jgi:hypothetical protein
MEFFFQKVDHRYEGLVHRVYGFVHCDVAQAAMGGQDEVPGKSLVPGWKCGIGSGRLAFHFPKNGLSGYRVLPFFIPQFDSFIRPLI